MMSYCGSSEMCLYKSYACCKCFCCLCLCNCMRLSSGVRSNSVRSACGCLQWFVTHREPTEFPPFICFVLVHISVLHLHVSINWITYCFKWWSEERVCIMLVTGFDLSSHFFFFCPAWPAWRLSCGLVYELFNAYIMFSINRTGTACPEDGLRSDNIVGLWCR